MEAIHCDAAPLEKFKTAINTCEYRLFPQLINNYTRKVLTKSEKDCWQYLYEISAFDEKKAIKTTCQKIGEAINRCARTVHRLLSALERLGFILKTRLNRSIQVYVRAPARIIDQILTRPRRRSKLEQTDINVRRKSARSYIYINNINNNNLTESEKKIPVVETQTKQSSAEIERLEKQKASLGEQFTDLCRESAKRTSRSPEIYEKLKLIGEKETAIRVKIEQLKQAHAAKPKALTGKNRLISDFEFARLSRALSSAPNRTRLVDEIIYSVTRGSLTRSKKTGGALPVSKGIDVALMLIKTNRWGTPIGMRN